MRGDAQKGRKKTSLYLWLEEAVGRILPQLKHTLRLSMITLKCGWLAHTVVLA